MRRSRASRSARSIRTSPRRSRPCACGSSTAAGWPPRSATARTTSGCGGSSRPLARSRRRARILREPKATLGSVFAAVVSIRERYSPYSYGRRKKVGVRFIDRCFCFLLIVQFPLLFHCGEWNSKEFPAYSGFAISDHSLMGQ